MEEQAVVEVGAEAVAEAVVPPEALLHHPRQMAAEAVAAVEGHEQEKAGVGVGERGHEEILQSSR